jgi:hypothetical protein
VLVVVGLIACGKKDAPPAAEMPARGPIAPPAAVPSSLPSRGAAAAPAATASGGEESSAATVTGCPKSLAGAESVTRVITSECGVVPVSDDYHLNNGELILEAGATLAFKEGTSLNIGYNDTAKLIVRGTAEAPVRFTSAGDKAPGVWKGVHLYDHADRSTIDHLIVEYAGQGQDGDESSESVGIEAQDVVFTSSTVRAAKGVGVAFGKHGTATNFSGNTFSEIGGVPVSLGPAALEGVEGPNTMPRGSFIRVTGGTIAGRVTWRDAGAPYLVSEDVHVDGQSSLLTIAAGVEVRFTSEAHILVGYSESGTIQTAGTEDAPVVLTSAGDARPGSWPALRIYPLGEGIFAGTRFEHGGAGGLGVLRVDGAVAITGCTFTGNFGGVRLEARAKVKRFDDNGFADNGKGAVWLYPAQLGGLGSGNRYTPGERIELFEGTVEEDATWRAQGAPIEVLGDLRIDGRTVLTVESGSRFAMKDKSRVIVGAHDNASLRLLGTAARPIELTGIRDVAGSWGGIHLAASSRDSVLEWVHIRDAGGEGGVFVEGEANARVTELACARCAAPVLAYACSAQVTASAIRPEDGTVQGLVARECP